MVKEEHKIKPVQIRSSAREAKLKEATCFGQVVVGKIGLVEHNYVRQRTIAHNGLQDHITGADGHLAMRLEVTYHYTKERGGAYSSIAYFQDNVHTI